MIKLTDMENYIIMMKKKYEREFKNDKSEGYVILYNNYCDKYEGEWKNDNKEGNGIYYLIIETYMKENIKMIK